MKVAWTPLWHKARKAPLMIAFLSGLWSPAAVGAEQGVFLNPAFLYTTKDSILKEEFNSTKLTGSSTLLNISAGYMFGGGLLLGAKFIQDTYTLANGDSDLANTETSLSAAGLSLGFKSGPLAALVSGMALQAPKKKVSVGDAKVTYDGGGGTQLDVMYLIDLKGWGFGPQLTWRSLTYKKRTSVPPQNNDDQLVSLAETELLPYISIFVSF